MTMTHFTFSTAFLLGVMGLSLHRTHLVSALLCIESMMLALFTAMTVFSSTMQLPSAAISPILLLAFSACEAGTGLALLVATSRTHGSDHLQNLNLLQC
uniref:NADH-ubiquinone oxidoreductase chain 4L n=1 Tax=Eutropis multifasciata TaxID=217868 RepID=A0A8F5A1I1_EUTMU|nr:NADH dehydrogenase subunit 4L [Eutropis multifasciata]QXG82719.1 NADH dehydrogenase subunit 4L [Eutropis multifasciata]UPO66923.1 NADH dehydrogenase subunit 4L [Eutropis multifasciata]UZC57563.1 NADH dehydrogenase subunit 4L [Eutropis multifasciata]UZC57576.1 NADH dehydrogenase subunit 4L [Eutropis multifasciata]